MGLFGKIIRSGDSVDRVGSNVREIDRILSELGKLYLQRQRALQLGAQQDFQAITSRITLLKNQLYHL